MNTQRINPNEPIVGVDGLTIGDFWSWAYSDMHSNLNRSVFAEYLVGSALGVTEKPRVEWDAVDLRYAGKTIEVKSAAYVQNWHQNSPSVIKFDIGMKESWDAATNTYLEAPKRSADCYVMSLYAEKDRTKANVLNIAH